MSGPLLVMAAGGTGGHMFPAQALAEEMLGRGWRVMLTTDARGARYVGGFPDAVEIEVLSSATTARGGLLGKLLAVPRIGMGVGGALRMMRRERPTVVVGFGGYPSIPALSAAVLLRLPRMIHEQNGVLGRVNELYARRVHLVACGTDPTTLPDGVRGEVTGNPVRSAIAARAGADYPGMEGPLEVLVLGGSQGARILSDVVPEALAGLPDEMQQRLRISQQARPEDQDRVATFYSQAGIDAEVKPFFDDVPARLERAHLVIARSGASTVADVAVVGRPAIFVPLATAIRGEQEANARSLVAAEAAEVLTEDAFSPQTLRRAVAAILGDSGRAARMADRARGQGRPDAAARLAGLVERLANPQNERT